MSLIKSFKHQFIFLPFFVISFSLPLFPQGAMMVPSTFIASILPYPGNFGGIARDGIERLGVYLEDSLNQIKYVRSTDTLRDRKCDINFIIDISTGVAFLKTNDPSLFISTNVDLLSLIKEGKQICVNKSTLMVNILDRKTNSLIYKAYFEFGPNSIISWDNINNRPYWFGFTVKIVKE